MALLSAAGCLAVSEDLGSGFRHHGVATPVSNHRGIVATVDGEGRNVALVWLFDHRGGYALLMIDAETGQSSEYPMPFPPGGDCPYSSILSSRNRFYTHFNSHFTEFDPVQRAFTFFSKTKPQMAMAMTEDDQGLIWSVTYPNSGLVSYNPANGELTDYGYLNQENWAQYQRYIATDDAGWVYFGIGNTNSQIVAFDPRTRQATAIVPAAERGKGNAAVIRDLNGKVYGQARPAEDSPWYELYKGQVTPIPKPENINTKPVVSSSQGLFHKAFPDGKRLKVCDTVGKVIVLEDPATKTEKRNAFTYTSEGAHIMGLAAASNGTVCGGTAFPMRFFAYDPAKDEWTNRDAYGQWNTVCPHKDRFYVGGYGGGFLLEWDPAAEWVPTVKGADKGNPRYLVESAPDINRPHDLVVSQDGSTVILAGTPGYGYTGGGLLFWERATGKSTLVKHAELLPEQSTMSLAPLPDGLLAGGTTTAAGTGGEKKAKEAELYLLDLATKRTVWHEALFPGAQGYNDLCATPAGLVLGFVDGRTFFAFDPKQRKLLHQADTGTQFGPCVSHQGPRAFVRDGDAIYALFSNAICTLDPQTFAFTLLAKPPVSIAAGGDVLAGRLYFAHGSHVYSYQLP
jgi:sugar lactone lactonase YvrE